MSLEDVKMTDAFFTEERASHSAMEPIPDVNEYRTRDQGGSEHRTYFHISPEYFEQDENQRGQDMV